MKRKILVALVLALALLCVAGMAMADSGHVADCVGTEVGPSYSSNGDGSTHYPIYTCSNSDCSYKRTGSIENCSGGTATCTSKATCSKCGQAYGSALGHDYSAATCTTPKTCSRCGVTDGEALGHSYSRATCTTPATCRRTGCGATDGEALGHRLVEVRNSARAATCTRAGKEADLECTRRGCDYTEAGAVIPALGHDFSNATCVTEAECARNRCRVTGLNPDNHAGPFEVLPAVAATCTSTGLKEGESCTACGNDTVPQVVTKMLPHDYEKEVVAAKSCTEPGYTTYTCKVCDYSYTEDGEAGLHWYGEWTPNSGKDTHSATCKRTDCGYVGTTACSELTVNDITICPVCGGVCGDDSHEQVLLLVEDAACASDVGLPSGEIVVRIGTLEDGTEVMTVAYEWGGKPVELTKDTVVTVTLPEGTLDGYDFDYTTNEDGTQSFTLTFAEDDIFAVVCELVSAAS